MAGEYVPLVLIPRFSAFTGATTFTTIAMDVSNYSNAIVNIWRGPLDGTSVNVGFTLQESTDQYTWSDCAGTSWPVDPTADMEAQYNGTLTKRWFRIKVLTSGTDPRLTCWAMGFLELRES